VNATAAVHRFASYTGARVSSVDLRGRDLSVEIRDRRRVLHLHAERSHEGVLRAPVDGAMERRIAESIDARICVRLEDTSGKVLFEGSGSSAGLEIVGDPSLIGVRV
jgi:tocopherol cyclase